MFGNGISSNTSNKCDPDRHCGRRGAGGRDSALFTQFDVREHRQLHRDRVREPDPRRPPWEVSTNNGGSWNAAPGPSADKATYSFTATTAESGYRCRGGVRELRGVSRERGGVLRPPPAAAPQVTTQPVNQVVASGSAATFTAAASGDPVPSVQWQVNMNNGQGWGNIYGANSTSYTVTDVTSAESGYEYQAVFTNVDGCATTERRPP